MSAWPEKRGEIRRMMEVAAADIKQLGGSVELVDIGNQKVCGRHSPRCRATTSRFTEELIGLR